MPGYFGVGGHAGPGFPPARVAVIAQRYALLLNVMCPAAAVSLGTDLWAGL
jgi:hypothetical protein